MYFSQFGNIASLILAAARIPETSGQFCVKSCSTAYNGEVWPGVLFAVFGFLKCVLYYVLLGSSTSTSANELAQLALNTYGHYYSSTISTAY